jgi:hypothetical protein
MCVNEQKALTLSTTVDEQLAEGGNESVGTLHLLPGFPDSHDASSSFSVSSVVGGSASGSPRSSANLLRDLPGHCDRGTLELQAHQLGPTSDIRP